MLAIFAIAIALGFVGVLVIEMTILPQQQAEARGCNNGIAVNASLGRCIH